MGKVERSEDVKKIRRKIEDKMRKDFSDEKILSLATLLDIETTKMPEKDQEN